MTIFNDNCKETDGLCKKDWNKLPEITKRGRDKWFVEQMLDVTEIIEAKKFTTTPQLWQIIYDLAHKIDCSPADEMADDHILIIGRDRQETDNLLVATEAILQVVCHCQPIRQVKECSSTIDDDIKKLRSPFSNYKLRYLPLKDLQYYQFEKNDGHQLFRFMDEIRVVATMSSKFIQLPQDIKKKFRIQVDLDRKRIFDPFSIQENFNPLPLLKEPPTDSQSDFDGLMSNDKKAPEAAPHTIIPGATADAGQKNVATANHIDEQESLYKNYFHSMGKHWEIRFNGEKGTVAKNKPFLYLLKYLSKPGDILRGDDIFREVQSDLGESAQRFLNEGFEDECEAVSEENEDDGSGRGAGKDRESCQNTVIATDLKRDVTSVLTPEQIVSLENDFKKLVADIKNLNGEWDEEERRKLEKKLQKGVEALKSEYGATMDPGTGEIIEYNRVARGRNPALEETRRNLKRSVDYLKNTQHEGLINLAEHIKEFLIKNKNIYQPPKDFPIWHITY